MEKRYEGLTIDEVQRPSPESLPGFAMRVLWSSPKLGFGQVDFYWDGPKLCANTECMSEAFLEALLSLLAKEIEIRE